MTRNLSNNKSITTKYILSKLIGDGTEVEIVDYGNIHENNCCTCIEISIVTEVNNINNLEKLLNNHQITETEKNLNDSVIDAKFYLSKNKSRNLFNDWYESKMPSLMEYVNQFKPANKEIKLVVFKRINSDTIEYEIVDSLCEFSKNNSEDIKESIFLHRKRQIWFIEGTGCKCSNFKPLDINGLDTNQLKEIILKTQMSID